MKKEFTCIVCPNGCTISAEYEENYENMRLEGALCKRGEAYVRQELTDYLLHSAAVMVLQGVNSQTMLYGGRWRQPQSTEEPSALNPHITGCMLLEAVCKVMTQTIINDI